VLTCFMYRIAYCRLLLNEREWMNECMNQRTNEWTLADQLLDKCVMSKLFGSFDNNNNNNKLISNLQKYKTAGHRKVSRSYSDVFVDQLSGMLLECYCIHHSALHWWNWNSRQDRWEHGKTCWRAWQHQHQQHTSSHTSVVKWHVQLVINCS